MSRSERESGEHPRCGAAADASIAPDSYEVGEYVWYVYRKWTRYEARILALGPGRDRITICLGNPYLSPRRVPRTRLRKWGKGGQPMDEETARYLAAEINRDPDWVAHAHGPAHFTHAWRVEARHVTGALHWFFCRETWRYAQAMRRVRDV